MLTCGNVNGNPKNVVVVVFGEKGGGSMIFVERLRFLCSVVVVTEDVQVDNNGLDHHHHAAMMRTKPCGRCSFYLVILMNDFFVF